MPVFYNYSNGKYEPSFDEKRASEYIPQRESVQELYRAMIEKSMAPKEAVIKILEYLGEPLNEKL